MLNTVFKKIFFHAAVISVITSVILMNNAFFGSACVFRALTNIPCPSCGMARSLIAMAKTDFSLSFYYYPMTVPFCAVSWFAIHKDLFKLNKKTEKLILIVSAIIIFTVYAIRLFTNQIP